MMISCCCMLDPCTQGEERGASLLAPRGRLLPGHWKMPCANDLLITLPLLCCCYYYSLTYFVCCLVQ